MQTTTKVRTIVEMFTDATAGESYARNRLTTKETTAATTALIGYRWMRLAEYDESEKQVTVYLGHKGVSQTATQWLNKIIEIAGERRTVTLSHESPVEREPPESVKYIDSYIGDVSGDVSPVEQEAVADVERSLQEA